MQTLLSFFRRFPILALAAVFGLGLPGCMLDTRVVALETYAYNCTATIQLADGTSVSVTNDDMLLGGGSAQIFAESNDTAGGTPRERALDQWKRYLTRRLSAPGASAEFQARFGSAPWCLLSAEATATTTMIGGLRPYPRETAAPLGTCSMPTVPTACVNPPSTVTMVDIRPSLVDFGTVPVGTTSPDTIVTIANVGEGRVCVYGPTLVVPLSPNRADFLPLDASDCAPRTDEERALGLAILDTARPACFVRVRVTPSDPGARAALLRLNLTDFDTASGVGDVPLTAMGDPGVLLFRATRCFNVAPVGGCYSVRHGILNNGPGSVTMRSVALPAAGMSAGWRITGMSTMGGAAATLPVTLAPGNLLNVDLQVCSATAPDTTLTFLSNSTTPVASTTLQGPSSGCTP